MVNIYNLEWVYNLTQQIIRKFLFNELILSKLVEVKKILNGSNN